jgi:hypothetical protein
LWLIPIADPLRRHFLSLHEGTGNILSWFWGMSSSTMLIVVGTVNDGQQGQPQALTSNTFYIGPVERMCNFRIPPAQPSRVKTGQGRQLLWSYLQTLMFSVV